MKDEIENIFKERFDKYEVAPSEGLFDKIQAKRATKRRALWIWSAAGIILVASLSIGIVHWSGSQTDTPEINITKNNKSTQTDPEKIASVDLGDSPTTNAMKHEDNNTPILPQNSRTANTPVVDQSNRKNNTATNHSRPSTPGAKKSLTPNNTTSENAQNDERAKLYAQIVQNSQTPQGKGKAYIRGIQQGSENPFLPTKVEKSSDKTPEVQFPLINQKNEDVDSPKDKLSKATHDKDPTKDTPNDKIGEPKSDVEAAPLPLRKLVVLSKWKIEVTASAGYGHRNLSGASDDIKARNATENGRLSYGAQVNTIYQLNPKWNVQLGADYTQRREQFSQRIAEQINYITRIETRERLVIHPVLGERVEQYEVQVEDSQRIAAYTEENENTFTRITLPLSVEYNLISKGKWKVNTKLGIDATLYQRANGIAIVDNAATEYTSIPYVRNNIFSTRVGLGVAYRATNRISLIAYPQVTYQLNSGLKSEAGYTQRDYTLFSHFGIRIGL